MASRKDKNEGQKGLQAARDTFNNIGERWRGCDNTSDIASRLRYAACAFEDLTRTFEELGGPFDVAGYRRLGQDFWEAAELMGLALVRQKAKRQLDRLTTVTPLTQLARAIGQRARSTDNIDWEHAKAFSKALQPLKEVAAELTFMAELISSVPPKQSLLLYRPYLDASMANMGRAFIEVSVLLPVTIAFISLPCSDLCTPCGTATGAYTFSGRFQVNVVQGGQRRVDPIFTITACCSESCLLIFSRCNTVTVDKVVRAPNNVALTNRAGVAIAKGQIRALIRGRRLVPPAFAATDCP